MLPSIWAGLKGQYARIETKSKSPECEEIAVWMYLAAEISTEAGALTSWPQLNPVQNSHLSSEMTFKQ